MKELFNKLSNFSQFFRENRLVNAKGRPETPDRSGPDDSHIDPLAPSGPDMSGPKLEKEHTLEESVLAEKTKKKKARKELEKYGKRVAKLRKRPKKRGRKEVRAGREAAKKLLARERAKEKKLFPWTDKEALRRIRVERQRRLAERRKKAGEKAKRRKELLPWESKAKVAKLERKLEKSRQRRTGVEYRELGPREIRKFEKYWEKTKRIPEGLVVYPPPPLRPGEELKPIEKAFRVKFDVNKSVADLRLNKRDRKLFEKYFLQEPLQDDMDRGINPENKIDKWLALPLKVRKSFMDAMRNLYEARKDEELSDLVRDFSQNVFEEKAGEEKTKELIATYMPAEEEAAAEEPEEREYIAADIEELDEEW